jgi:serine/threonine protein kinase
MPKELKGHLDEYILEEEIGVGVTSHVYRAIRKSTGQRVAVKIIEKHSMTACMYVCA